jgi:predicted nucleic acid-binding protein
MIVIDASAALRWFIPADLPASEIWRPGPDDILAAPDLFALEVRSATLRYLRARELTREAAADMLGILDRMIPDLAPMAAHMKRIWALACELDHSPYDCTYLALAEHADAQLVTADKRLIAKLRGTPHASRVAYVTELAR